MAKGIIEKNFSNYSAWHYRGKLMPQMYEKEAGNQYTLPLKVIREDLESLKHAYFTDPKDQSPWNYHDWLISIASPIQVVALHFLNQTSANNSKSSILVGLSHQVKNFNLLDIDLVDKEGNPIEIKTQAYGKGKKVRDLASSWEITFDHKSIEDTSLATLSIRLPWSEN